jgi:hypothetical protein
MPWVTLAPAACKTERRGEFLGQGKKTSHLLPFRVKRALPKTPRRDGFRVSLAPRQQNDDLANGD